ncbi:MAG: hypothetical protein KGL39_21685 [Patescibacteria group bacterium]|nr:hypothetical protein [Patescibacteria group bacterium]
MGAISDQMMQDGLQPFFDVHGQKITVTSGRDVGKPFLATILVAGDIELNGEVVKDNREKSVAIFNQLSWPSNSYPSDMFKDESGQKWKFGKRTNNPVDQTVEFEIIKITGNDK